MHLNGKQSASSKDRVISSKMSAFFSFSFLTLVLVFKAGFLDVTTGSA